MINEPLKSIILVVGDGTTTTEDKFGRDQAARIPVVVVVSGYTNQNATLEPQPSNSTSGKTITSFKILVHNNDAISVHGWGQKALCI